MWYALIKGEDPDKGTIIDVADFPDDLNYSKLKHCSVWSVWIFADSGVRLQAAGVNWCCSGAYLFRDMNTDECCNIHQHSHILPMVRGALVYNHMFQRFKPISVCPI